MGFPTALAQPDTSSTIKPAPTQASGLFGSSTIGQAATGQGATGAYTPSVTNSGLFGSTGNTAAAPSNSGPSMKPSGNAGFNMNNFGAKNESQAQAPVQKSTINSGAFQQNNSFMMSANNQSQPANIASQKQQEPASSVSLAGMKKKNVNTNPNAIVPPQQVNMRQKPKESCLMPVMDGDKLKAVTPACEQIMAII